MHDKITKKPQKATAFDLLASLAIFAREHRIPLNDPSIVDRFTDDATSRLREALDTPTMIYGSRTQQLFEATVLSLGKFKMLKTEDTGRVHSAATIRAPDFRIVLDDDEQWLVEVKNVHRREPSKQITTMSAPYLSSLQTYADMVGTPLKVAIYWSRWNIWTIVSPDRFRRTKGGLRITMADALVANETGRLGEVIIMTKAPLRFVLGAAQDMPISLGPEDMVNFTIGSAKIYSGDAELIDPKDRKLAMVLLLYGEWTTDGPYAVTENGTFAGVEFVVTPEEPLDQDWEVIGWASRIFSRFYATQTIENNQVVSLHGEPAPEWFAPLAHWDFATSRLPLVLGHIQAKAD